MHEEIELLDGPGEVLGCRHVPSSPPAAGVVVCSAGPFDAGIDTGRTARLGRRLAEAGVAVQRVRQVAPPTGEGVDGLGFAALVDAARRCVDLLRDRTGVDRVGLVGARVGALVAARVARDLPAAPLALWEPVVDPRTFLEQAAQRRAGRSPDGGPRSGEVPPYGAAPFDPFATPLAAEFAGGALVGGLLDELGDRARRLLLVQTGPGPRTLRPDYADVVARARARRLAVDVVCDPCDGWRAGVAVPVADPGGVIAETAAWLASALAGGGPEGAAAARHGSDAGVAGTVAAAGAAPDAAPRGAP